MALAAAMFVSLFPNQDLLFLLSIASATAVALPVSTKDKIDAAINGRDLKWPLDYLKKATRSCGLAAVLFGIQYVDNLSPSLIFPSSDIFVWVGLFVGAIAGFYTVFVIEFILNPNFRPPITLYLIFLGLFWVVVDYLTITLGRSLSPSFGNNILGTGFILLMFPSVISSALNWWMDRKNFSQEPLKLSLLFIFLPYIWAFGVSVLLSALSYIGL